MDKEIILLEPYESTVKYTAYFEHSLAKQRKKTRFQADIDSRTLAFKSIFFAAKLSCFFSC